MSDDMQAAWKDIIWQQFGAAIDTLGNALDACPDDLWQARLYDERELGPEFAEYWYQLYHCLFFLDYYLSDSPETFAPPAPFTLSELDPAGLLPPRVYSKDELRTYLAYGRQKCRRIIEATPDPFSPQRIRPGWVDMSVAELWIHNMRHVQEHAAQFNLFLGQRTGSAPGWVKQAKG